MERGKALYLSSLGSVRFKQVRECRLVKFLAFETGKSAAHATIHPGVPGQDFGYPEDISELFLTTRFKGDSIDRIEKFPVFVFITVPDKGKFTALRPLKSDDLRIIAWGELYRSPEDAAHHKFD